MQLILILLLLNSLLKASISSGPPSSNEKKVKNKGRLSRVTWLMHENENDNLNHRMFEDDDDKSKEKTNNKMHYKKRKYNFKVEHKRRESIFQNLSKKGVTISNRKEIAVPKYVTEDKRKHPVPKDKPNELDTKVNKNKFNKTNKLHKERKDSKTKEKPSHYNRNYIETGTSSILKDLRKDYKESNKINTKDNIMVLNKTPRRHEKQDNEKTAKLFESYLKLKKKPQVHRKPKKVYLKKEENPNILAREEPRMMLHLKMDPNKNIRNIAEKNRENMLKLVGLNFASLANPPKQMLVKAPKVHDDDNTYIADELAKKVRVLCWVITHPDNHNRTCKPIKDTWGKRCNKLLFISTEYDSEIPTVKLEVREGRSYLWPKVKAAFKYVYDNYHDQYDWFLRADDDTFLVVENLRYLLSDFDPQEPIYFGCRFKHFSPQGFMSGGASIALSVGALERLVEATKDISDVCKVSIDDDLGTEDVNLGKRRLPKLEPYMFGGSGVVLSRKALQKAVKAFGSKQCEMPIANEMDDEKLGICLSRIGVKAMDSRDVAHKGRFLVFMPQDHVSPTRLASAKSFWYWKYVYYPTEIGEGCCSDYAISFHYVTPDDMYALDYLIYRIRPFGIQHGDGPVPKILGKIPTQKKTANNRKTRTKDETTTVTYSTIASTSYDGNTEYTQEAEGDVITTEFNEKFENGTIMVSKTTHSDFYEQVNEASDFVSTEIGTSAKVEALARENQKITKAPYDDVSGNSASTIFTISFDGKSITNVTVNSKPEYEEI